MNSTSSTSILKNIRDDFSVGILHARIKWLIFILMLVGFLIMAFFSSIHAGYVSYHGYRYNAGTIADHTDFIDHMSHSEGGTKYEWLLDNEIESTTGNAEELNKLLDAKRAKYMPGYLFGYAIFLSGFVFIGFFGHIYRKACQPIRDALRNDPVLRKKIYAGYLRDCKSRTAPENADLPAGIMTEWPVYRYALEYVGSAFADYGISGTSYQLAEVSEQRNQFQTTTGQLFLLSMFLKTNSEDRLEKLVSFSPYSRPKAPL